MKSDEIPCFICTTSIPSSSRRYGGRCCKSCAAFFARSIKMEKDYKCKASNDCLISPSVLGKGCRRCRFDKCIEIGMSTNGMQPQTSAAPVAPTAPTQATPLAAQPAPKKETVKEKAVIFAKIIDTILANSIQFSNMITEYLGQSKQDLISDAFKKVETADITKMSQREFFLAHLFLKYSIAKNEFASFMHLLICKVEVKWLPIEEQSKIKFVQNFGLTKLKDFQVSAVRLIELSNLSQHFLNIFYAFS